MTPDQIKAMIAKLRADGAEENRIELFEHYARRGRLIRAYRAIHKHNTCAALRRRDGQPCLSKPEPPYRFCRFHGGVSKKGKMSPEGRERCRQAGYRGGTTTQMRKRQRKYAEIFGD
jgi:hypothetical protein